MIRVEAPLETVPMFVRAGAIIPLGPEMNYVGEKTIKPMTFMIHPDENGQAETTLYEDDGVSPAYKQGVVRRTRISAFRVRNETRMELSAPEGSYHPGARDFVFVLMLPAARRVLLDGKPLGVTAPNGTKPGWYSTFGSVVVRIADDNRAHHIDIESSSATKQ